jgi:hypothetical protein
MASAQRAYAPAGPDRKMKITQAYAALVARDAFFWAWPIMNVLNRRAMFAQVNEIALAGPLPVAPLNRLGMLTDYVEPEERSVACPNQDVVYGVGAVALDQSPVVIQVPDFGERFWVYQIADSRTDSFAPLGKMYRSKPGHYLLARADWKGKVPKGIVKTFRCPTSTGIVAPRVFQDDTPEDKKAIQSVLRGISMYPLAEFDGQMKMVDWAAMPKVPAPSEGEAETVWVPADKFLDLLAAALADAPPLAGEEARYQQVLAVLEDAKRRPGVKDAMLRAAAAASEQLIVPLLQFRNYGIQLAHHWSTIANGAAFGTDYFTRTAVAKSNIFVNAPNETKYFYQDLDVKGERLNGANRYAVTFAKDATPPVDGFWSITLYNEHHFFAPNAIKRFSLGTKNKTMKYNADGSLTLYVQADEPEGKRDNWLPAPKDADFSLFVRAYWPKPEVVDGAWTPPPVIRIS